MSIGGQLRLPYNKLWMSWTPPYTRHKTKTSKAKTTTQCVLDTTMRKQTQITKIRPEPSYKQLVLWVILSRRSVLLRITGHHHHIMLNRVHFVTSGNLFSQHYEWLVLNINRYMQIQLQCDHSKCYEIVSGISNEPSKNHNTMCAGHHYAQTNTNNEN
jgi:hypothetical protein